MGIVDGSLTRGWRVIRGNVTDRGGDYWNGQGAIEAGEETGLGGEFDFPALAGDGVDRAGCESDTHSAGDVSQERSHQTAATAADEQAIGVTFVVVLFLDDFPFRNFHIVARLAVRIDSRAADGDEAHLDGDKAAVDFDAFESEVHVRLTAEKREILGPLDGADYAVNAGAGGENDAAVESDGLSENGDEGIPFAAGGTADGSEESKVDFCALNNLARLGASGHRQNDGNG